MCVCSACVCVGEGGWGAWGVGPARPWRVHGASMARRRPTPPLGPRVAVPNQKLSRFGKGIF